MQMQTISRPSAYEQTVVTIMRKLPADRNSQIAAFARFMEFELFNKEEQRKEDASTENATLTDDARWDILLASDESQNLLDQLADEVLAEIQAGQSRPMIFTEDGEIAPG